MGKINPRALLIQSKKKKAPARFNVLTIMACNLVLILFFLSIVFFHRNTGKRTMGVDDLENRVGDDSSSDLKLKTTDGKSGDKLARRFGGSIRENIAKPSKFAVMNTTKGVVTLELFAKEAPRIVEIFVKLSETGYYSGLLFHRVVKGFMIQGGDPKGDGSRGVSISWAKFEEEFHSGLKHEPFTLSMANSFSNSTGSQFFITTVGTPFLDNYHSVFGRVVHGQDVVREIEDSQTDSTDRPLEPVVIHNITIKDSL